MSGFNPLCHCLQKYAVCILHKLTVRRFNPKLCCFFKNEPDLVIIMLHRKDFYPDQLSGGQQQRVAIARAIAFKPEVLLFDEPTSALDPELTREVLNTITQLAADGLTLVVVTHEMGFARNVSDRIIFMENGVVAEEAPAKEFFLHPRQEASKRFLRTVTDDYDYSI